MWVVSTNKSNCLLENKMISTLIWRHQILWLTIYLTITDHKFPVSYCTLQPKILVKLTKSFYSSMNAPTCISEASHKNNPCTPCVPMFFLQSPKPKTGIFCFLIHEARPATELELPGGENVFVIKVCIVHVCNRKV